MSSIARTPFSQALLALAVAAIATGPARAEDKDHGAVKSAPVVVTATRFDASIDTAPVNIVTISAEDIANSSANSVSDVLRYQAGVSVSSLFGINGSRDRVDLGGFGENGGSNTLILLNGRRLNDLDLQSVNLASIPLDSVARIEIVQGSGSVLYGDNAVGGVINIVTKSALDGERANVSLQYGSFDTRRLSADLQQMIGDTALSLTVDGLKSDGYRERNELEDLSLMGEASRESGDWFYGARINANREELQLPGSLNEPEYLADPRQSNALDDAKERRYSVEAFIEGRGLAAELAVRNKSQEYRSLDSYGGTFESQGDLRTLSFTPRAKRRYGRHQIIAGIDLYQSSLDASSTYRSPFYNTDNAQDVTQNSNGLYLTDAIHLGKDTILSLGARQQWVKVKADNVGSGNDSRSDSLNSWDISLSRKHNYGATNYLRLAKSFRTPVLDEMWNYTTGGLTLLKPQTALHYEIGSRHTHASGVAMNINLFRMDLKDEIAYDLASYANVNLEKTRRDGVNLGVKAPIGGKASLQAGYAWRKASYRAGVNDGKEVPLVPRNKFTLGARYDVNAKTHLGLDAIYTGSRYFGNDDANAGKKLDAYTRLDLNYRQQIGRWNLQLLVQNLTNVKAADSGFYRASKPNPYYYYPLPQRAAYLKLGVDI